jgi:stage IV sporulation protein FB
LNKPHWAQIKIRVHPLFWLVATGAALTGQFIEIITLFVLVFMHELGHVLAALAAGWRVQSIELLPFGGVAKMDESGTTKAKDEVIVALSGPFVNLSMIAIGYLFFTLGIWEQQWTDFFIRGNVFIAGFNLLPVWPLDGGKVLHTLLSKRLAFRKSIYVCLAWSTTAIFLLIALSFFLPAQLNLVIICIYLLVENRLAWKRAHYQFLRFLLMRYIGSSPSLAHMPILNFCLPGSEKVGQVVKLFRRDCYHYFQIIDNNNQVVSGLPEGVVLAAFFEKSPHYAVSELISIG